MEKWVKAYQDSNGNTCTLFQMVQREPNWAASRIRAGEEAIAERDRLIARISELTQCDPFWYDMSVADAFRMWAKDKEKMKRMRQVLEQIATFQGVDSYGHVEVARKAIKEAE